MLAGTPYLGTPCRSVAAPNRGISGGFTGVRTYVRMTSDGSPLVRLRRALRAGDLLLVRATAAEMPFIGLADALAILHLIEARDEERFEPAAVRWAGRLATEVRGLTLAQLRLALDALDALPSEDARATLAALAGVARRPRPTG